MKKGVPVKIRLKLMVVVVLLSLSIIFFMGKTIYYLVHNFYNKQMEMDSQRIAKSYASSLEKAMSATETINQLLSDKIMAVSQMIAKYNQSLDNDTLSQIAKTLSIDEIYSYDNQGTIVNSSSGKYIGWVAYEGHPVYDFIHSNESSKVEEIRKDSESDTYYKYGYYRREDNSIVQIGIKANKIYEVLDSFKMDSIMKEMTNHKYILEAYFMDNNYNVLAGENQTDKEFRSLSKEAKMHIDNSQIYSVQMNDGKQNIYQIMVPIEVKSKKVGTLVLGQNRTDMDELIRRISVITYSSLSGMAVLILVFITFMYKQNNKLVHQVYHNHATNLANKRCYDEFMPKELKKNKGHKNALMVINYRNLDFINAIYGYRFSEDIIKKTAEKLADLCEPHQYPFHISDDRFAVYFKKYKNCNELYEFANAMIKVLKEYSISNKIGGSIGIYEINQNSNNTSEILKSATLAANNKYAENRYGIYFYNEDIERVLQKEERIENELKRIIYTQPDSEDFYLDFQPILDLKTNQISSFEALARLKTSKLGLVSPLEFINIAEKTGLIIPLGERILEMACQFINQLKQYGHNDIKVAVNVSGIQLLSEDFIPSLMQIIKEHTINPSNLEIELTESVFSNNFESVNEKIAKLRSKNIDISIDDFGTGYSSFARESDLDVTTLKIDKFFIDKLIEKDYDKVVAADIITMAHKLGHRVIAEGVESEEQKQYLIHNHCDYIQGYVFSKPLDVNAAINLLKNHNSLS